MEKKNLINEILKVITLSENFDPNDYDDEYMEYIIDNVTSWVEDNNVENVEFTLSKGECEDVWGDPYIVRKCTNLKVNLLPEYDDVQNEMEKVLGEHYEGPGWDGEQRTDDRWNSEYFFTGSDCTQYVLVKKIA